MHQEPKPGGESWDAPPQEKADAPLGGESNGQPGEAGKAGNGGKPGEEGRAENGGSPGEGKPGEGKPSEIMKPGKPDAPAPAVGVSDQPPPPPSGPGDKPPPPSGGDIPLGAPPLPEGVKGVKISGTVAYANYKGGLIQIDINDRGPSGGGQRGSQPKVIQLYRMEKPGAFELEVPQNQGDIWLTAYNDEDKNGRPSREEPRGTASANPYKAGTAEIKGVEIKLEKERIPAPP